VAGTPNFRDLTGACAPLLSHATARPRQAGTSFESQATPAGRRLESQPAGTSQRYEHGALPSRPGPATPTYNWGPVLALSVLRCRSPAPASHCLRRLRLGAGFRRRSDFDDAEVAKAGIAMRAAGPLPGLTPYRRRGHQTSTLPRSPRTRSRPNGRRRRLQGSSRTCAAGLEFGSGWCSPSPRAIRPNSAPPPETTTTLVPEPACTTIPLGAQQLSSADGWPAEGWGGVSPRAVTHRSAPIPRTPARRYRGAGAAVRCGDGQRPGGDRRGEPDRLLAVPGTPGRPWPQLGRTVPRRRPGDDCVLVAGFRAESRWLRSPWLDQLVTGTGSSPRWLSSTPAPIPRWPG
jgi:hypothetical protein